MRPSYLLLFMLLFMWCHAKSWNDICGQSDLKCGGYPMKVFVSTPEATTSTAKMTSPTTTSTETTTSTGTSESSSTSTPSTTRTSTTSSRQPTSSSSPKTSTVPTTSTPPAATTGKQMETTTSQKTTTTSSTSLFSTSQSTSSSSPSPKTSTAPTTSTSTSTSSSTVTSSSATTSTPPMRILTTSSTTTSPMMTTPTVTLTSTTPTTTSASIIRLTTPSISSTIAPLSISTTTSPTGILTTTPTTSSTTTPTKITTLTTPTTTSASINTPPTIPTTTPNTPTTPTTPTTITAASAATSTTIPPTSTASTTSTTSTSTTTTNRTTTPTSISKTTHTSTLTSNPTTTPIPILTTTLHTTSSASPTTTFTAMATTTTSTQTSRTPTSSVTEQNTAGTSGTTEKTSARTSDATSPVITRSNTQGKTTTAQSSTTVTESPVAAEFTETVSTTRTTTPSDEEASTVNIVSSASVLSSSTTNGKSKVDTTTTIPTFTTGGRKLKETSERSTVVNNVAKTETLHTASNNIKMTTGKTFDKGSETTSKMSSTAAVRVTTDDVTSRDPTDMTKATSKELTTTGVTTERTSPLGTTSEVTTSTGKLSTAEPPTTQTKHEQIDTETSAKQKTSPGTSTATNPASIDDAIIAEMTTTSDHHSTTSHDIGTTEKAVSTASDKTTETEQSSSTPSTLKATETGIINIPGPAQADQPITASHDLRTTQQAMPTAADVKTTVTEKSSSTPSTSHTTDTGSTNMAGRTSEHTRIPTISTTVESETTESVETKTSSAQFSPVQEIEKTTRRLASTAKGQTTYGLVNVVTDSKGKDSGTTTMETADVSTGTTKTQKKTTDSGETTTMDEIEQSEHEPIVHFEDLNVEEVVTEEPAYCLDPCPPGYNESTNFCFKLAPMEKSMSYGGAISYCQAQFSPTSNLATAMDYQAIDNKILFEDMLAEDNRTTNAFWLNMEASARFRKYRIVDIISLNRVTRFNVNPYVSVDVMAKMEGLNAMCRVPKYCGQNTCPMEIFYEHSVQAIVGIPPERTEMQAGEKIAVPCIQFKNTGQTHTIQCRQNGEFSVHPSLITCKRPDGFEEDEIDTPLTPLEPTSCSQCYEEGTDHCTENVDGHGVTCHCKLSWTKATCWASPDLCTDDLCGPNGNCVSLVDRTECVCNYGFTGDRCEINATRVSLFGSNATLAVLDVRSIGLASQSMSSMFILFVKIMSKIFMFGIEENADPQDTYQDYRHTVMTIGGLASILFTHPGLFGADAIGCRFYYLVITICYTLGLLYWVNESLNVYSVCRAANKNEWNRDFSGKHRKYFTFNIRVIYPTLILVSYVIVFLAISWTTTGNSWNCFGSYQKANRDGYYPLFAINSSLAFLAVVASFAASLVLENRPHAWVLLTHYFNLHRPAELETINKVRRNLHFVWIGPILHLICWICLSIASEENKITMDTAASVFSVLYAGFNIVQMLITDPGQYSTLTTALMCLLPKAYSPTFDWGTRRNRDEVLALNYNSRYKKEQKEKVREEDIRRAEEKREIKGKNARLLEKYPALPQRLLFHVPEEGPAVSFPKQDPFNPRDKNYMTVWERQQLLRIWTRSYLDIRAHTKQSPDEVAFDVLTVEIERNMFQTLSEERKQQELFLLAKWWKWVPGEDRIKLRPHERGVIMEDPEEDDMLAFERAVSEMAARVDIDENRRRRALLNDEELVPFTRATEFINFLPTMPIKQVKVKEMDEWGQPREKEYIKVPDILLDSQIEEMERKHWANMQERNEPFDRVYDDDLMVTQWAGSGYEEAVKEILNVFPSQIGEHPISMNPRKRPLDKHWFYQQKPDFFGPREEATEIPLGPYGDYARKCAYFQKEIDYQWHKLCTDAARRRFAERLANGEI